MSEGESIISIVLSLQSQVIAGLNTKVEAAEAENHRLRFVRSAEDTERTRVIDALRAEVAYLRETCEHPGSLLRACAPKYFGTDRFCIVHPAHDWPCPHASST